MALRIELDGDKPGIAKIIAQKWKGSADIDMLIQRNQDGYYLSSINQWEPEKNWHTVQGMTVDNEKLEGLVNAWLVDSLLSQESHVRFLIQIRDNQNPTYSDGGAVKIAETVLASSALDTSSTPRTDTSIIEEPVQQVDEIIEPEVVEEITPPIEETVEETTLETVAEPVIEEEKVIEQPVKPKSKVGLIAIIIVILLILAGLAWYFLFNQKTAEQTPVAATTPQNSECALSNAGTDELAFIQQCLQSKPDTQAILQLISEAKTADKCNIAQRLYANQAQQNATIAVTYAKEYDDKFYQANNCFKADKETAIYWYETTLTNEPDNTLAKERLAQLQK